MTQFVKFIRKCSGPWLQRSIGTQSNSTLRHKNRLTFSIDSRIQQRSQHRYLSKIDFCYGNNENYSFKKTFLFGTTFAFLGFFEKEEEKEPALITTIKRSILLIQKGEFKKAEQMLHVALRQAQSLQSEDGITYVYDVMANLAFEVGEFDKAEKLFKSVMQRVLSTGTPKDDLKMVHMSLKMSKILEHKGEYSNAEIGYKYCLNILQPLVDKGTEDIDILTLWAMNLDWYAHLLLSLSKYNEAMSFMEKAYELCVKLNGEIHEQTVVLLNDLGSISFMKENLDDAVEYLNKAIKIGDKLPDMEDLSSIYVNLGNVLIKKGLLDEAKKSCSKGWKLSKQKKNLESIDEAKACLDEVNKLLTN